MKKDFVIGILGGMGTYATIHIFRQYAKVFVAKKEWERPRIIIDNRCTMPSRVRAFLYEENVEKLINEMTESLDYLMRVGCNRILLGCNTAHLFLPQIYEKLPYAQPFIMNVIDGCVEQIHTDEVDSVYLLATEGTIESGIYQSFLDKKGINCISPQSDEYAIIRDCIEAVKQDIYTKEIKSNFLTMISRHTHCILGCTELPVLYEMYADEVVCNKVYDPILIALQKLKREFENE